MLSNAFQYEDSSYFAVFDTLINVRAYIACRKKMTLFTRFLHHTKTKTFGHQITELTQQMQIISFVEKM